MIWRKIRKKWAEIHQKPIDKTPGHVVVYRQQRTDDNRIEQKPVVIQERERRIKPLDTEALGYRVNRSTANESCINDLPVQNS